ncbi:hypothetical protein SISNIDRAFT_465592 [Sistotremastrum niveocremeum HHB9708]|uniref:Glucose receptor Git3 N-terminal domain-containing protein n=1 Tax=Sistotremastrum niveocremeum HHB9708 TaxID=1314777 RepID=A0A164VCB9_9AGAM|nr:hypothetical protein SISNIDRAFT_465592 [Sistotremastrum niveocremeum HHB9708]
MTAVAGCLIFRKPGNRQLQSSRDFGPVAQYDQSRGLDLGTLSLLFSDLLLSIGTFVNVAWIRYALQGILEGHLCTTQAVLKEIGQIGIALSTLSIAVNTWGIIMKGWPRSPGLAVIVVLSIWSFSILICTLPLATHKARPFYGNAKYWCSINASEGLLNAISHSL